VLDAPVIQSKLASRYETSSVGHGLALCKIDAWKRQRLRPEHSESTVASTSARHPIEPYSRRTHLPSFMRPNTAERIMTSRVPSSAAVPEHSALKYSRSQYSATTPARTGVNAAATSAPTGDFTVDDFCEPTPSTNLHTL